MRDAETKSFEQLARDEISKTANGVRSRCTSQMIERVARAIYQNFFDDEWPPKTAPDLGMGADDFRKAARAAIEAMMEPTNAMLDEAEGQLGFESADLFWKAMLRKALRP